jgi:hypothetical protein
MATIVLGCDKNDVNDKGCRDTVARILEKAGHNVEKLAIAPGPFADYSYSKKGKGKIGVYLIAAGTNSISDFYYGGTSFKYAYFGIRGDIPGQVAGREPGFSTKPIGKDADCRSNCDHIAGLTFKQMNEKLKDRVHIVCGSTPEEIGNNLVKAINGENATTSGSKKDSVSTIKQCIQELLYPWNGEVSCVLRDDTLYINRIKDPTETKLSLVEGDNVFADNITLTDIDPKTPNILIVTAGDNEYTIKDEERIKRFGEVKKTLKTTIKGEKDIVNFTYREWNKILKDSGRQLEVKVSGDPKWRNGEWVRVYIPSFNLNGFMFTTKVSHDDNGEWDTSLTLVDYPPDLGVEPSQKTDNNSNDTGGD